jgi:hypothetical protein
VADDLTLELEVARLTGIDVSSVEVVIQRVRASA